MNNDPGPDVAQPPPNAAIRFLRKLVDVRAGEVKALMLGFVYYFLVLSSYYVIRPIRDDFGAAGGIENLPWMFTATLLTMLITNTIFSRLVARFSRRRFIPIAYRFFIANLVIFLVLLATISKGNQVWVGRVVFVWSCFLNFFVVSFLGVFMFDFLTMDRAKRFFPLISTGGPLGPLPGASITAGLVKKLGTASLLLISVLLLELSAQC